MSFQSGSIRDNSGLYDGRYSNAIPARFNSGTTRSTTSLVCTEGLPKTKRSHVVIHFQHRLLEDLEWT
jgi:hypothetical protein